MVIVREPGQGRLVPTLGLFSTAMLVIGSMIGSGIFRLPAAMMDKVRSPELLLLVWVVGGVFTILGALTFAEMAGMFPKAGGQYVFLRESMGRRWAFLYSWSMFWVIQTGIIAGVAVVFGSFVRLLFGVTSPIRIGGPFVIETVDFEVLFAVACILFLTLVNYFGVKFGGLVNNFFTIAKFAALLILVVAGFIAGNPDHNMFSEPVGAAPSDFPIVVGFILAMLASFFALDGWPQAAYVAPEVKNPTKTVPRAMLLGVGAVTVIYIAATAVYLYLLPAGDIVSIAGSDGARIIAPEAARVLGGDVGMKFLLAGVIASTFGTVNAYILTTPRIFYAVAKDRLWWKPFERIHPRYNTPDRALIYQSVWACLIVVLAGVSREAYITIIEAVVFGIWLFYIPTVIGYFRLRRERPDVARPFKTPGYPVVPILFGLCAVAVVGTLLYTNISDWITKDPDGKTIAGFAGIWGSVLILTGVPAMWLVFRTRDPQTRESPLLPDA